ncbi:acyloxyacyl hydrolase [uncultured Eudoraea sp.]|uniref:acyloxyacyl hydrolase n=1 Tax=uncultured Eudoraea sp. TaxID=1035614 RepID=UPI0026306182|nr:acyloxyacyl hydrolase [uncultured Eudoraea sp.]
MDTRLFYACLLSCLWCFSQKDETSKRFTVDANPFYGSIILHNTDISHLINEHPAGVILGFNKKNFGSEEWHQEYNYPDTGISFIYQGMKNKTLGDNYSLYLHYNFYFFKRNMQFRIGQGLAYNTNPYDKNDNFRNNAYGSHIMSTTFFMLNYHKEQILKGLGFKAGISIIHYSNANVKAPNTSTNTFAFNAGLVYDFNGNEEIVYIKKQKKEKIKEPIRANLVFRTGINESDVVNSGQFPFYIFSAYADKRLSRKSGLQLGADLFFSNFLKELISFQATSFPESNVDPDTDYKRVGMFLGYELYISKLSAIAQLGYYVYYPFDFEGRVYNRIGLKYYFGKKIHGAMTLKSHGAKAEAVEFGFGIRL